jgi:large subunit ribosomal protein L25
MPASTSTALSASLREPSGSRSARRLRRQGQVPGVVYGGGEDPVAFSVNARELRHALADAGAVLDLQIDGGKGASVMLKELIRHPVNGELIHVDLLRVRLDRPIQSPVLLELTGTEEATGVRLGGVLEQPVRELLVEALPTEIPDSIQHDILEMEIGDTLTLGQITAPGGVTIIGEPDTLIATISAPRLQLEGDTEIETETEVVGEGEGAAEGDAEGGEAADEGGEAAADGDAAE